MHWLAGKVAVLLPLAPGFCVLKTLSKWHPYSWQSRPAQQLVDYPDAVELQRVLSQLEQRPALVHPSEITKLRQQIAEAGQGRRFLVQAGECAERFIDCQSEIITEKMKILLQLSLLAAQGVKKPVVAIGRIAGQFGKPRSDETEKRESQTLPSYRGDIINGFEFSPAARRPDPHRMLDAYQYACATLNWMRAVGESGLNDISRLRRWTLNGEHARSPIFRDIAERIEESIAVLGAWGDFAPLSAFLSRNPIFTSHEALLLPYESALTRWSEEDGSYFNLGTHFLWLGERTRQLEGAHVEYLKGIANPLGIKVGPSTSPDELIALLQQLNPNNEWGRITLITRLGQSKAATLLPALVNAVREAKQHVTWACDPMHGNIVRMSDGVKTRYFDSIMAEVLVSQRVHHEMGSWLGGLHLEITAEDVTECVGGEIGVTESQLALNYQSYCDPRLNHAQSLELMMRFCDAFKGLAHCEAASGGVILPHRSLESAGSVVVSG
ncbi:MAG: Phospho-2-dehydro-3-deoxyheptonate aldolase [Pseudomonadota bacterium]|jgi:3-deoxy-7-phosphoheptulonate synthase